MHADCKRALRDADAQMHGKSRSMLQGYNPDNSKGTSPKPAKEYSPDPASRYNAPLYGNLKSRAQLVEVGMQKTNAARQASANALPVAAVTVVKG